MRICISLLRGINVSGKKKIKMEDLRKLYESLNFTDVQTYIQSGNVVFRTELLKDSEIANLIIDKIKQVYGYIVTVIIRTKEDFQEIVKNNPYIDRDLSKIYVVFLSSSMFDLSEDQLNNAKNEQEEYLIMNTEIYLFLPNGAGRTRLTNNFFERKLKIKATSRNWNSVTKILSIANSK